jgi:hypothetical protein
MIQMDPLLEQQLNGAANPVAFCDAQGRVLGHFLPEEQYAQWLRASYDLPLSPDEAARRGAEPAGHTLKEIWQRLGRK